MKLSDSECVEEDFCVEPESYSAESPNPTGERSESAAAGGESAEVTFDGVPSGVERLSLRRG